MRHSNLSVRTLVCAVVFFACVRADAAIEYVISISVDGLGSSYLQSLVDSNQAANFKRFQTEGAWTNNARNDYDITVTLPSHTTMVTGRGILGATGHGWTDNGDPAVGQTLATNKGSYVASVFDVAHDNGLRTAVYSGKTKFSLFDTSYNATNGAADTTGVNNGKDKVDTYEYNGNEGTLTSDFISAMTSNPYNYTLLHFADPDAAGHGYGWGSTNYINAVKAVNTYLGNIFNLVTTNATLQGKTAIILTADHGGKDYNHADAAEPLDYTIPFYVWGPGVAAGADLYGLNTTTRVDPLTGRPLYSAAGQPIRNGEVANLSLDLLGLGAVPGSTINAGQNLAVPEPSSLVLLLLAGVGLGWRLQRRYRGKIA